MAYSSSRRVPILPLLAGIILAASARAQAQQPFFHADSGAARRTNLGDRINTYSTELLPILSPDGSTLYFDRKYSMGNVGGRDDDDDIYYCTLQPNGTWSPARNIGPPLNTPGSDVLFWISADGQSALVHNGREIDGRKVGLAISTKDPSGNWGEPVPIAIDGLASLNELGEGYSATISPDGRRLILAISRDTADAENLDLFSCPALSDDYLRWGQPVSLGGTVNTVRYEWAPFMAADNRTLYFASGGQLGFGRSDIFMSRRLDDTWEHWSDPYNLGPTINTAEYEAAISIAPKGDVAYLSAAAAPGEKNLGKTDIYRVVLPAAVRPIATAELRGTLSAAGKGMRGSIRVRKSSGEAVASAMSDEKGAFMLRLPVGEEYRVSGSAEGYDEAAQKIDLRKSKGGQVKAALSLKKQSGAASAVSEPRRPGATSGAESTPRREPSDVQRRVGLTIDSFAVGSAEIPRSAIPKLQQFLTDIRTLWAGTVLGMEVVGYTDDVGTEHGNQDLSSDRADRVKRWLVENGVDVTTVIAIGRGEDSPVVTNGNEAARARNRRVVIRVVAMKTE